jgi:hypothetical protein
VGVALRLFRFFDDTVFIPAGVDSGPATEGASGVEGATDGEEEEEEEEEGDNAVDGVLSID